MRVFLFVICFVFNTISLHWSNYKVQLNFLLPNITLTAKRSHFELTTHSIFVNQDKVWAGVIISKMTTNRVSRYLFQVTKNDTRATSIDIVLAFFSLAWNMFLFTETKSWYKHSVNIFQIFQSGCTLKHMLLVEHIRLLNDNSQEDDVSNIFTNTMKNKKKRKSFIKYVVRYHQTDCLKY